MPLTRRSLLAYAAATATAPIGLAACSSNTEPEPQSTGGLEKITYVTGLDLLPREAYALVAKDRGDFTAAGFDVDFQRGAAGDANLTLLRGNRAQFAVIDYAGAVQRAATGQFDDVRCVAAISQNSQIAIMGLASRGIRTPQDLAGKTIGQIGGAVTKTLFGAYAQMARFDSRKVTWINGTSQTLVASLMAGRVDAIGLFTPALPGIQAQATKYGKGTVTMLPYSDHLTDLYGNVLVTRKTTIDRRPEMVKRFAAALLQGLAYMAAHPETVSATMARYPGWKNAVTGVKPDVVTAEAAVVGQYAGLPPLGGFDATKVAQGIALEQSLGMFPHAVDPDAVVAGPYVRGMS